MAGGEGTRLRPLTSNAPKPMMPLANRPMMEHIVDLLKRHGFDDIVVTDPDSGETITATLTLADSAAGSLTTSGTAVYHAGGGVWTITDTVANVNAALASVAFVPASDYDQDTSIAVHIADGGENGTTPATGTITLPTVVWLASPTFRSTNTT